jgi:tetratricopeptide (TPR) repeat protein
MCSLRLARVWRALAKSDTHRDLRTKREASKVLVKMFRPLGVTAVATALCVSAWGQAAQTGQPAGQPGQPAGQAGQPGAQAAPGTAPAAGQKNWKDRAEYDLYESITKTQDANKRLELVNQWKDKYPTTDFKKERLLLYLDTYRLLNNGAQMLATAREIVAQDPADMTGLYWLNMLLPVQQGAATNPALLSEAEKAGNGLLQNMGTAFSNDKKPASTSDADWTKARNDMEALGHKTLGWVAMVRKNNEEAEKHFRDSIRLNPSAGEVAYWLGTVLYAQKKVPEGLFFLARAATYDGPGALSPAGRKDIDNYVNKAYVGYHGDTSGLDQMKQQAKNNAAPPAGWTLESVTDISKKKLAEEEQRAKSDPQGTLWQNIKTELTGDNGQAYFDSNMKGAKPPAKSFRGKVVSATTKEIKLAMSDDTTPEATLRFDAPIPKVDPGTTLQFTGVADNYTKSPFMVVFDAEKGDVDGLPKAAPAKRAPARRATGARSRGHR